VTEVVGWLLSWFGCCLAMGHGHFGAYYRHRFANRMCCNASHLGFLFRAFSAMFPSEEGYSF
jgi:hypothetical protein